MKTIVGFMDNYSEAEELVQDLTGQGYDRDQIDIVRSDAEGVQAKPPEHGKGGFLQSIKEFFGGQRGTPQEVRGYYEEGVRRGGAVVAVTVDDPDVERISNIMSLHGAVDIEQRAEHWRSTDTMARHHDPAASEAAEPMGRESEAIPGVEEEVRGGKPEDPKGKLRVVNRETEQPVEEEIGSKEDAKDREV